MADDGHRDDPPKEPARLPARQNRPPRLTNVTLPAPPRDTRGQLTAQRNAFSRTYLGMLQEPEVVDHIRTILSSGTARDVGLILAPLSRVLFPPEESGSSNVQVNLIHGVPRPPTDVTPS